MQLFIMLKFGKYIAHLKGSLMLENFSLTEIVSTGVVALGALTLGIKQLLVSYASSNTQIASSNSQTEIIEMLSAQAQKFAQANDILEDEVSQLRIANTQLSSSVELLTAENKSLRAEVERLRLEVARLVSVVESLK